MDLSDACRSLVALGRRLQWRSDPVRFMGVVQRSCCVTHSTPSATQQEAPNALARSLPFGRMGRFPYGEAPTDRRLPDGRLRRKYRC
jgi:hypothetical protein